MYAIMKNNSIVAGMDSEPDAENGIGGTLLLRKIQDIKMA
jgi:hypothetical protein